MSNTRRKDPLVWGLILIVLGALFLLERFDIGVWDTIWRLWPVILIIWGGLKVYNGLQDQKKSGSEVPPGPAAKP